MKEAIINGVLLVRYSECFSCGEVLICDVIFLNIPAEYVHIDFAYSLVQKSTKWLWRRTGNARCEHCCCNCMKKREKSILSFLKSGHISSPQKKTSIRSISKLITSLELGAPIRDGIQTDYVDGIDRTIFISLRNIHGSGSLDLVFESDHNFRNCDQYHILMNGS